MRLRTGGLPVLTILAVSAALACFDASATPADKIQIVTDAVQTAEQFDARSVLNVGNLGPNMQDAVAGAFFRTASIKMEYRDVNQNLPAPSRSPYPNGDWPEFDIYPSVYDDYAATYHDTLNYPWVVFYVNHLHTNRTDSCGGPFFAGYSPMLTNRVFTNRAWRYSFIFVTDIQQRVQTMCGRSAQELENLLNHVVAHEYGHQRAGLTHYLWQLNPPGNAAYHQGRLPQNREDVMAYPESAAEALAHPDPVLDAFGTELPGDNTTCRGNLLTNQSVH
jgi:hypothetical protein